MRAIFMALALSNVLLFAYGVFLFEPHTAPSSSTVRLGSVPELRLLHEGEQVSSAQQAPPSPSGAPSLADEALAQGADLAENPLCTLIGPFETPERAEALVQRLQSLDTRAEVRDIEVSDGEGYWVYLAPELSHRAALRRLHELQSKQIDSYIIPRGELANGISFGMFTRRELAEARRVDMQARGYEARIREIERTHREIWVLLPPGEAARVGESLWQELLAVAPALERRQNFCPGVASG